MATDVLITPAVLEPLIDVLTRACQAMRKAVDAPTNPDATADERWTLPATWARSRTSWNVQERDHLLERALERHVDLAGGDVNQPGGQLGEEPLETQPVRQQKLPGCRAEQPVAQSHLSRSRRRPGQELG
jgi:hypothetical protein